MTVVITLFVIILAITLFIEVMYWKSLFQVVVSIIKLLKNK